MGEGEGRGDPFRGEVDQEGATSIDGTVNSVLLGVGVGVGVPSYDAVEGRQRRSANEEFR